MAEGGVGVVDKVEKDHTFFFRRNHPVFADAAFIVLASFKHVIAAGA